VIGHVLNVTHGSFVCLSSSAVHICSDYHAEHHTLWHKSALCNAILLFLWQMSVCSVESVLSLVSWCFLLQRVKLGVRQHQTSRSISLRRSLTSVRSACMIRWRASHLSLQDALPVLSLLRWRCHCVWMCRCCVCVSSTSLLEHHRTSSVVSVIIICSLLLMCLVAGMLSVSAVDSYRLSSQPVHSACLTY